MCLPHWHVQLIYEVSWFKNVISLLAYYECNSYYAYGGVDLPLIPHKCCTAFCKIYTSIKTFIILCLFWCISAMNLKTVFVDRHIVILFWNKYTDLRGRVRCSGEGWVLIKGKERYWREGNNFTEFGQSFNFSNITYVYHNFIFRSKRGRYSSIQ